MLIRIDIPTKVKLLVKIGQPVDFGDRFYQHHSQSHLSIPLADRIHVRPARIFQHLNKVVGNRIEKGEIIAWRAGFLSKQVYRSEVTGVLKEINHHDGSIVIEQDGQDNQTLACYFKGTIAAVAKNAVILEVADGKTLPLKEASGNFGGLVHYLTEVDDFDAETATGQLAAADKLSAYQEVKLEALGVTGFVTVHRLPQPTGLPYALMKMPLNLHFPYCIIDRTTGTAYFYK